MNPTPSRRPASEFSVGARRFISSLRDSFLHDEDLDNDLNAALGADEGPMGVAGSKRQREPRRGLFRCTAPTRDRGTVPALGRSVTRLDRMLGHLVSIAEEREWEPPYPNVADLINRGRALRLQTPCTPREFTASQAHLRLMAMVALDLLDELSDDEPEEALAISPSSGTDGGRA
ncbi:hypothetical protein [Streptomyces parvus]|uniref:Uncharacterized protein n=1 Tax=Streptomyces parvus TaxID=66428 RepID=A0A7K3S2U4_9ACTN|nr:hypothetical protein [Streptomyces parvus]NEC21826.1 hypothetical protein [Streptomyces parvus]